MEIENSEEFASIMLKKFWVKFFGFFVVAVFLSGFGLLAFRITCVTFVDNYEIGYKYSRQTGKIERLDHTGYIVAMPFITNIHTIDGLNLFLKWHGRDDYGNSGYNSNRGETPSVFNQILMAYAYEGSGKNYPFLTVIRELKPEEMVRGQR